MTALEWEILTTILPTAMWAVPLLASLAFVAGGVLEARSREAMPCLVRRHRARLAWLDPSGRTRPVRSAVVRRVRRVVLASAVLVDELTLSARAVAA